VVLALDGSVVTVRLVTLDVLMKDSNEMTVT
jgi:hypothetical protein